MNFQAGVYRHYKGRCYLALGLAQHEDEADPWVVYVRLYPQTKRGGLPFRIRPLSVWLETVPQRGGGRIQRFEYIGVEEPKT